MCMSCGDFYAVCIVSVCRVFVSNIKKLFLIDSLVPNIKNIGLQLPRCPSTMTEF